MPKLVNIQQLNEENEVIGEYDSAMDAARKLGTKNGRNHIHEACEGKRKTAFGFKWRFNEDLDFPGEIWITHPGLPVNCSNIGRVQQHASGKQSRASLKWFGHKRIDNYRTVMITTKQYKVHRLILQAFVGESKNPVDHIDHDCSNNKLENLRYVTASTNNRNRRKFKKQSHLPYSLGKEKSNVH